MQPLAGLVFFAIIGLGILGRVEALHQTPKGESVPAVDALTMAKLQIVGLQQTLELTTAQRDMCVGQLAPQTYKQRATEYEAGAQAIVKDFEAAHPGWTVDLKTGQAIKKGG